MGLIHDENEITGSGKVYGRFKSTPNLVSGLDSRPNCSCRRYIPRGNVSIMILYKGNPLTFRANKVVGMRYTIRR